MENNKYKCWACLKTFSRKKDEFYCPKCSKLSMDKLRKLYPDSFKVIYNIRPFKITHALDKMGVTSNIKKKELLNSIQMKPRSEVISGHAGDV